MLAKHALSQLSYSPDLFATRVLALLKSEQLTLLRVHALSQLSYSPNPVKTGGPGRTRTSDLTLIRRAL
jgi:hypothetical protein